MKEYYVYIVAGITGTLYIGMTNNLKRRIYEHREGIIDGFTKKYKCKRLLYYESGTDVNVVINREKQLKNWNRRKKEKIIKDFNPGLIDLYDTI